MPFQTETLYYLKTIWSDLHGSWLDLRQAVTQLPVSTRQKQLLFHIDEGMSWESVRDLRRMEHILLLVSNIIRQEKLAGESQFWAENTRILLLEVKDCLNRGENL